MAPADKATFLNFFNEGGYVFDFSNDTFDNFTLGSVGFEIRLKYKLSKGSSLQQFARDSDDATIIKLFTDLIYYYEKKLLGKSIFDTVERHNKFLICKNLIQKYKTNTSNVYAPTIKLINNDYIKNITIRALKNIDEENFDSAITKSRTLLEEVFCYAIEKQNQAPITSGNITNLYNQVKELYNMHQDSKTDKRINELLSGLNKIINSISEMRNENSDAHGVGQRRINIKNYHARLFVNSATVISDFILAIAESNKL